MQTSARNVLKGTFWIVTHGAVNTEGVIEIAPGVEVVSIITKASADRLGLAVGGTAYAVVKASDVMVGVD